jgi:class 3 adenylate cyclase/pimeloyl-ACP methyl ester carboxylesterase
MGSRVSVAPTTRYARSDGAHIAYHTLGDGPLDLLELPNGMYFSIEDTFDEPRWERFERGLASFARVIRFDFRGIGMSDPFDPADPPSVGQWVRDALAVMDDAGSERAVVFGVSTGGLPAMELAATFPDRVGGVVLMHAFARVTRTPDYPAGMPAESFGEFATGVADTSGESQVDDIGLIAPSLAGDERFRRWWHRAPPRAATPAAAQAQFAAVATADERERLEAITAPTLVLQRAGSTFVRAAHAEYLAEHIPGARYVELPGIDHLPFVGAADAVVDEIELFVTGARRGRDAERILATLLFTDIVGSTEQAAALGDRRWNDLLSMHHDLVRAELERFRGREISTSGDGVFAVFDGPARAIRCACAIRDVVRTLDVEVRAGLHSGEVEVLGDDVGGIAVNIGARVAAAAAPSEVLVSRTVADLVAGSGFAFVDRGVHQLKGVPGDWQLLAVAGTEPAG